MGSCHPFEACSALKRGSRFFVGPAEGSSEIEILTDALEDLSGFLEGADARSVEKLTRDSVESWLDQTEAVKGCVGEGQLLRLSRVLQDRRVVNFLARAGRRFSRLASLRCRAPQKEEHNRRLFYSLIKEHVDSSAKNVVGWLVIGSGSGERAERSVLSLLGPSGIGKTTLARRVYEAETVRGHFDCRFWVDVSRSYVTKDLLIAVIEQMARETKEYYGELSKMRSMQLFGTLRQALQAKRYSFVFDDVCHEAFWHVMKQGLPDNSRGSRVIITTSIDGVVNSGSFDEVCPLGPLSFTNSWELFCGIALQDEPEQRCPRDLVQLATEILGMCKRFPLPILGIAGLLSKKEKRASEWRQVYERLKLEAEASGNGTVGVSEVLALSFHDLPYRLRQCFLYFSVFPKDSVVPNDKLFRLWIAEGFVEENTGKTLEDVAEEYLDELILRDLVQPCQGFYGLDRFCQVDEFIHDFARAKADELGFCRVLGGAKSSLEIKSNRLVICNKAIVDLENIDSRVSSVFLLDVSLPSFSLAGLITKCTTLMLLDFECCPIESLPEEAGTLVHLKHLGLKNTKVRKLPKSVQNLQNLQTLDVRNTLLVELPNEINTIANLRHLLASAGHSTRGVRVRKGIGNLLRLETLTTLEAHRSGVHVVLELARLRQLRTLGVSGLTSEVCTALCACINEFGHLESLTLQVMNDDEVLSVGGVSSSRLTLLRHLVLKGRLEKLPEWIPRLQNLTVLCLSLSRLTEDSPIKHLSCLPNLASLWLYRAYEGDQLYFEEGSFKKLKLLVIKELHGLNVLEIEDGALPSLEELRIGPSPLLNHVPNGIQYLRNLKVLANYDMPIEFAVSVQPDSGWDYWKVKHIASVIFVYRVRGRNYKFFELGDPDFLDHLSGLAADRMLRATERRHERELSFCESDDGEEDDGVGRLSFSAAGSTVPSRNTKQWSFSSGFYTDDLEE